MLDSLSGSDEAVMTALLRNYGGLFADYQYVDESIIASQAQLTRDQCYQTLKSLSKRNIIHYIPQRKMPYITLIRDREEEVFLPKSVYEDRKEQYIKRIGAITAYAGSDEVCRSQQLLRYFGEEDVEECGHCDVCLAGKEKLMTLENPTVKMTLALLSDKRPHPLREVASIDAPQGEISRAVDFLMAEEKIKREVDKLLLQ